MLLVLCADFAQRIIQKYERRYLENGTITKRSLTEASKEGETRNDQ